MSEPNGAHRDAAVLQRRCSSSPGCGVLLPVLSGGNSGARQGPVQDREVQELPCRGKGSVPLCHQCSQAQHSCGSRQCSWYINEMPAGRVAVWSLLSRSGTCYSRAKQVSTGSQRSHKEYLLIIHSSLFVCKYPLLLAPTCVTFYLEMCFCSGARAQHSPWKAESLSVKNSKAEVCCRVCEGEKPRFLLSLQHLAGHCCSPWTGVGKAGQPWLFGNASCVLPLPASICCRLRWHPSHAGITWVITIS